MGVIISQTEILILCTWGQVYELVTVHSVGVKRVALSASCVQGRLLTPRIHPVLFCWIIKSRTWPITFKELCANRYTIIQYYGGEWGIRTPGTFQYNSFQDCRIRPLCQFSFIICLPLCQWTPFFNSIQRYTIFCSVSNLL